LFLAQDRRRPPQSPQPPNKTTPSPTPSPTPTAPAPSAAPTMTFLGKLPLATGDQPTERGLENLNNKQFPDSIAYSIGFTTERTASTYNLDASYSTFTATVGLDRASCSGVQARFQVLVDGVVLFNQVVTMPDNLPVSVLVKNAHQVEIVSDWGNQLCGAMAVWGTAHLNP